ncbi:MAG: helix-turn-helix transcriptional regulator [Treponema sp.]|nr:helix-turn-helix transcriptional regulator [Treponema sp.]MBQ9790608.1 helix-turn-helix transcriptional regulator [Clostridia bacterium]
MAPFDFKVDVIKKYMVDNKLSKSKFCKKCNIGMKTLNKVLNCDYSLRMSKLFKIAKAMNVHVLEIIEN